MPCAPVHRFFARCLPADIFSSARFRPFFPVRYSSPGYRACLRERWWRRMQDVLHSGATPANPHPVRRKILCPILFSMPFINGTWRIPKPPAVLYSGWLPRKTNQFYGHRSGKLIDGWIQLFDFYTDFLRLGVQCFDIRRYFLGQCFQ